MYTEAMAFAKIVGLIGEFSTHTALKKTEATLEAFIRWLEVQHADVAIILKADQKTLISIKALLHMNQQVLLERLNALDQVLTQFASGMQEFRDLAEAVRPDAQLSEQALTFLRDVHASESGVVIEAQDQSKRVGVVYIIVGGRQMTHAEPKYIVSNVQTMIELGLLLVEDLPNRSRKLQITRKVKRLFERHETGSDPSH